MRSRGRLVGLGLAAVLALVAVAGCTTGKASSEPSRAEAAKQSAALCAAYERHVPTATGVDGYGSGDTAQGIAFELRTIYHADPRPWSQLPANEQVVTCDYSSTTQVEPAPLHVFVDFHGHHSTVPPLPH